MTPNYGVSARFVGIGETIVERQHNGHPRKVVDITDEYVVCERGGRRTKIKRTNLGRYVIVGLVQRAPAA